MRRPFSVFLLSGLVACGALPSDAPGPVPGATRLFRRLPTELPPPGLHHVTVRGRWVDAAGMAHAGASTCLLAGHGRVRIASATCDEQGRFQFDDVCADGEVYVWGRVAEAPDTGWWLPPCDGDLLDLGELRTDAGTDVDAGAPDRVVTGSIRSGDGTPIAGARVLVFGGGDSYDPAAIGCTDARGHFAVSARLGTFYYLDVDTGGEGSFSILHVPGRAFTLSTYEDGSVKAGWGEADLQRPLDIVLPETRTVWLTADGADGVRFARQMAGAWYPLAGAADVVQQRDDVRYRAEADGWLPLFLDLPHGASAGSCPFDAATARPFVLAVTDAAGPVPDAQVELWREGRCLACLQPGADGRLTLRGAADAVWQVVVTAPGHVLQRATWSAAAPLSLRLPRLDATLLVPHLDAGQELSVFVPGAPLPVTVQLGPASALRLPVPTGELEAVLSTGLGAEVLRSVAVSTTAAPTATLPDGDQRGRIGIGLPPGANWHLFVAERLPEIAGTEPRAVSMPPFAIRWLPPATVHALADNRFELSITRSGRLVALASQPAMDGWLLREQEVSLATRQQWATPELTSHMTGSCRTLDFTQRPYEGYSGPRLLLRGEVWDRLVRAPAPTSGNHFRVDDLDPGEHVVFAHLAAAAAWGGVALQVPAAGASLGDFADLQAATLPVRVVDAKGAPVRAAELRVRDPMYECQANVLATRSSAAAASYPLPPPPHARLDAAGKTALPAIRRGWLELHVALDDGRVFRATAAVAPLHELLLQLPPD